VSERATVCGNVASTHYASSTRGSPTFLNLDAPYPHEIFAIVIWGGDRAKFDNPEVKYRGANLCATGTITSYRGVPEIAAHDPSQLEVEK